LQKLDQLSKVRERVWRIDGLVNQWSFAKRACPLLNPCEPDRVDFETAATIPANNPNRLNLRKQKCNKFSTHDSTIPFRFG
jgi:hypothetical protein